jgi:endonuclease VIII
LSAQPGREIGQALLDQRNLAGIGNLYQAECLFLSRESPWSHVVDVPDLHAVVRTAHRLLQTNREHPWQVTTGVNRRGREHWVYDRSGRPCRRCGSAVRSASQGQPPYDRVTYWCPVCQPTRP